MYNYKFNISSRAAFSRMVWGMQNINLHNQQLCYNNIKTTNNSGFFTLVKKSNLYI